VTGIITHKRQTFNRTSARNSRVVISSAETIFLYPHYYVVLVSSIYEDSYIHFCSGMQYVRMMMMVVSAPGLLRGVTN